MLMKQCQRCYAMNRRTDTPLQVCNYQQQLGASLSEPHTSVTALQVACTCMSMYVCACVAV